MLQRELHPQGRDDCMKGIFTAAGGRRHRRSPGRLKLCIYRDFLPVFRVYTPFIQCAGSYI